MAGLGPFDYIVTDADASFFQEASEGIAKEASLKGTAMERFVKSRTTGASIKQLAAAASRRKASLKVEHGLTDTSDNVLKALERAYKGGYVEDVHLAKAKKLASLIRKSNELGLTKQASEQLIDGWDTYTDILNVVAASSPNEPLGMTKTACDFADAIEEIVGQNDSLDKIADLLVFDSLWVDAVNEGLTKEAIGGIRALLSAAKKVPGALRAGAGALRHPVQSVRALGVRGAATQAGRAVKEPISTAYHARKSGILGKHISRAKAVRGGAVAQREMLRKQIAAAGKNPALQARLGGKLRTAESHLAAQTRRQMKAKRQLIKSQRKAGTDFIPSTARSGASAATKASAAAKASKIKAGTKAGARKAKAAATPGGGTSTGTAGKAGASTGTGAAGAPAGTAATEMSAFRTWQSKPGNKNFTWADWVGKGKPGGPAAAAGAKASTGGAAAGGAKAGTGGPGYQRQRRNAPAAPSTGSPPPNTSPSSIQNKPGFGGIYDKWSKDGWAALSGAEKRKVYVGAGVAFAVQRGVLGKEERVL